MQCMLDTDTCIYLMKKAAGLQPQSPLDECCISTIVLGELEFGVAKSRENQREQNREALLDFVSALQVMPLNGSVSEKYGHVRFLLKQQQIGPNDTWIAAHALALALPLVTNNLREYERVPGLEVTSWMSG